MIKKDVTVGWLARPGNGTIVQVQRDLGYTGLAARMTLYPQHIITVNETTIS